MTELLKTFTKYELERGKPMPSKNHGIVQTALIGAFLKYAKQFTIISELSLQLNGFQPTPDISVYSRLPVNWLHDEVRMTEPPLLVVEIMSPLQGMQEMIDKIEQYLHGGVKSCWLVQTPIKTITVFTQDMHFTIFSSGTIKDPATAIEVSIEEIFSQ